MFLTHAGCSDSEDSLVASMPVLECKAHYIKKKKVIATNTNLWGNLRCLEAISTLKTKKPQCLCLLKTCHILDLLYMYRHKGE